MKYMFFVCGLFVGFTSLSVAMGSVPRGSAVGRVTDDTAMYQKLSEIRVPRHQRVNFDQDIARLSMLESRYQEKLPALDKNSRVSAPMKRISQQKYRYSGAKAGAKKVVRQ